MCLTLGCPRPPAEQDLDGGGESHTLAGGCEACKPSSVLLKVPARRVREVGDNAGGAAPGGVWRLLGAAPCGGAPRLRGCPRPPGRESSAHPTGPRLRPPLRPLAAGRSPPLAPSVPEGSRAGSVRPPRVTSAGEELGGRRGSSAVRRHLAAAHRGRRPSRGNGGGGGALFPLCGEGLAGAGGQSAGKVRRFRLPPPCRGLPSPPAAGGGRLPVPGAGSGGDRHGPAWLSRSGGGAARQLRLPPLPGHSPASAACQRHRRSGSVR